MKEIKTTEEFQKNVLQNNKTVLVDFYANWCGPCRNIAPIVKEVSQELQDKIDTYKVDIDQAGDLAADYMVQSIPTFIIFKNGQAVDKKIGSMSKSDLIKWVESHS
ncbi:MAG: thioredoxin [Planctomycetes bacterium]|jgi:thioredoxin 1|nr:thioredoxin [Planctomycetota bacterium]HON43936.1 thioredoxin [Planctomycetota bacterium]HRU52385.1 thioredoxin [Planctomycetota bacterium]